MKRSLSRILCVFLCLLMLLPGGSLTAAASEQTTEHIKTEEEIKAEMLEKKERVNKVSNFLVNEVLGKFIKIFTPDCSEVVRYKDFRIEDYPGFYPGMEKFIDKPEANACWSLGYGSHTILPSDFGEKKYAKGAYAPNIYGSEMYKDSDGITEDLKARAILLGDGSGRGKVLFIVLDCIGISNTDVRMIRENLKELAEKNNIVSINVSATHTHTGIDSAGLWTDPLRTLIRNTFPCKTSRGVDRSFLSSITKGAYEAAAQAVLSYEPGELLYTAFNAGRYIHDRTTPHIYDPDLYKLEFVPLRKDAKSTIIASVGCHPESASYHWAEKDENGKIVFDKKFSPDFIWGMEKIVNSAGYNFIFIQGNLSVNTAERGYTNDGLDIKQSHTYAERFGYELGYITLSTAMNTNERKALNERLGDKLGIKQYNGRPGYSPWYYGLETVKPVIVSPFLNIAHEAFIEKIDNNLIAAMGKTGITDSKIIKKGLFDYYTVTEVGFLQIGDAFRALLSPGETYAELRLGGEWLKNCSVKSIAETVGPDVIVFDLMNDFVGYLANDGDFVYAGYEYEESSKKLDENAWCLFSLGRYAGTDILLHFYELAERVKK